MKSELDRFPVPPLTSYLNLGKCFFFNIYKPLFPHLKKIGIYLLTKKNETKHVKCLAYSKWLTSVLSLLPTEQ